MSAPRMAAHIDWMQVGAFSPEQYTGDQRKEYEDEAALIERKWDNQPR